MTINVNSNSALVKLYKLINECEMSIKAKSTTAPQKLTEIKECLIDVATILLRSSNEKS